MDIHSLLESSHGVMFSCIISLAVFLIKTYRDVSLLKIKSRELIEENDRLKSNLSTRPDEKDLSQLKKEIEERAREKVVSTRFESLEKGVSDRFKSLEDKIEKIYSQIEKMEKNLLDVLRGKP